MLIANLVRIRGNVYLAEDLGDIKTKLANQINRQGMHSIGYKEEKKADQIRNEREKIEVDNWLDENLSSIPTWDERRDSWLKEHGVKKQEVS